MITKSIQDSRRIECVYRSGQAFYTKHFIYGGELCNRIEIYGENGQMEEVPWIAVFLSGDSTEPDYRFSADGWTIRYCDPELPPEDEDENPTGMLTPELRDELAEAVLKWSKNPGPDHVAILWSIIQGHLLRKDGWL